MKETQTVSLKPAGAGAKAFRKLLHYCWRPLVAAWLKRPRVHDYRGLRLRVLPGVFHPGFFYSSHILADYVAGMEIHGKTVLDVGCGSGIVALAAAKKGAVVTAIDINALAVQCTMENAAANGLVVEVLHSDLFSGVTSRRFDVVAVNPPYYRKKANTPAEHAWNAGPELEYFNRFFLTLRQVTLPGSKVYMILSEDCDMNGIVSLATTHGYVMNMDKSYTKAGEILSLFRVVPI
jgi:release factor glutamine methyltransferase